MNPLDNGAHGGELVGQRPAHQGQLLKVCRTEADAGVEPHRADIEGQPPVALNEIHRRLGRVQQSPEVVKAAGIRAEHPQKIVARTHGVVGHSGVAEACGSGNSLVKGAVAAAGIDAHRLPPLRRRPGQLGPVAGVLGDRRLPWLVPPGQGSAELLPHLLGAVVFSRVGVD